MFYAAIRVSAQSGDFCSVINGLSNEEDIALHLDIHGNSDCMQFVDETTESWVDVANLLNIIRNNIRVLTMNACKGAYLLDSQTKEGIPFLDYVIASKQDINVSEGCSRCHLFYNELYKSGNVLTAWQKFNDQNIINNSNFHLYKEDKEVPLDKSCREISFPKYRKLSLVSKKNEF